MAAYQSTVAIVMMSIMCSLLLPGHAQTWWDDEISLDDLIDSPFADDVSRAHDVANEHDKDDEIQIFVTNNDDPPSDGTKHKLSDGFDGVDDIGDDDIDGKGKEIPVESPAHPDSGQLEKSTFASVSSSENSPSASTTAPASESSADDPTTVSAPKSSPDDSAPKSPTDHSSAAGADDSSDTQTPSKPNIEEDSGDRLEAFIANAIDQVTENIPHAYPSELLESFTSKESDKVTEDMHQSDSMEQLENFISMAIDKSKVTEDIHHSEDVDNVNEHNGDDDLHTSGRNDDDLHTSDSNDDDLHTASSNDDELHTSVSNDDDLHTSESNDDDLHAATSNDDDELPTSVSNDDDLHTSESNDDHLHTATSNDDELHTSVSNDDDSSSGTSSSKMNDDDGNIDSKANDHTDESDESSASSSHSSSDEDDSTSTQEEGDSSPQSSSILDDDPNHVHKHSPQSSPGTTHDSSEEDPDTGTSTKKLFRCPLVMDIIIVVHGSNTILPQNFTDLKCGVVNFIESMTSPRFPNNSHIGYVQYSDDKNIQKHDISSNKNDLKVFVYDSKTAGTGTRTDLGLLGMNRMFAANVRPGVPRLGVVVTYGLSPSPVNTAQQAFLARRAGITLVAIGITNKVRRWELNAITGRAGRHHVYLMSRFDEFKKFVTDKLKYQVCVAQPNTTTLQRSTTTTTPKPVVTTPKPTTTTRKPETTTTIAIPMETPPTAFRCPFAMDLVIAMQGSNTILAENFMAIKSGIVNFIEIMTSPRFPDNAHIGCIQYSDKSHIQKYGIAENKHGLKVIVHNFNTIGTGTRTDLALLEMNRMFASNARPGVPRVGVLVTYGLSPSPVKTAQQAYLARKAGVDLFVIGITDKVRSWELNAITGRAGRRHMYMMSGFEEFKRFVTDQLIYDVCELLSTTTTTTTKPTTPKPTTPKPTTPKPTTPKPTTPKPTTPKPTTPKPTTPKPTTPKPTTPKPTTPKPTTPKPTTTTTKKPTAPPPVTWDWQTLAPTTTTKKPDTTTTVPTTTTRRYTTTTGIMETPPPGFNPCVGCKMVNGAGFNPHPTDCSKFVQCFFHGTKVSAYYVNCPVGHFWSQEKLTCDFAFKVNCVHDLCHNLMVHHYANRGHCQAYWECQDGHALKKCCPAGQAYKSGICVPDPSCPPTCTWTDHPKQLGCKQRAVPGKPSFYEQNITGYGWVLMPCAPGTSFDSKECKCSDVSASLSDGHTDCEPEVILDFDKGIRDTSGKSVWVTNKGVKVRNGVAIFDGRSEMLIQRFTNDDLGDTFIVRLRYRQDADKENSWHALVSNGDCGQDGSIVIATDPTGIRFGADTDRTTGLASIRLKKPITEWKNVEFKLADGKLHGRVNNFVFSRPVPGRIERRPCAIQIGHGWGLRNFIGEIDHIAIYKCKPTTGYRV